MAYIGKIPAAAAITASDLDPAVITGQTALAVAPADTDEFLISDGGVLKRLDASLIGGGGKIGQVLQAVKTDTQNTTTDNTFTDVAGLTIAITPSASNSKILVLFTVNASADTSDHVGIRLLRGSTDIFLGTNANAGQNVSAGYRNPDSDGNYDLANLCGQFLDSPSTTSATTYKIQAASNDEFFINRPHDATGTTNMQRPFTASSITVMEILA